MKYTIRNFKEGVSFESNPDRLTILLLVPFYSFDPKYETRRVNAPLGLEYIANELLADGFNVIFIDAARGDYNNFTKLKNGQIRYGLTNNRLKFLLSKFNPDIVGITSLFSNQLSNTLLISELIKTIHPSVLIAHGGAHASGADIEVLTNPCVDIVVRREGMITFKNLCKKLEAERGKRKLNDTLSEIMGISYKNSKKKIIQNPDQPFVENLDELAPRRYEIELHSMYDTSEHTGDSKINKQGRYAYLMTSFGCDGHCKFCTSDMLSGPKTRFFSLERIEREIIELKKRGVNEIIVEDDQFLAVIPRAMKIMDIFKKHQMRWFEEGGISMFKLMRPGTGLDYKKIIDKFAESGCYRFYLAIESANISSLQTSNKPPINAQANLAEQIVKYIKFKNIQAVGGFMLGFKTKNYEESMKDIKNTLRYAKQLKKVGLAYVMLFIFTPLPGTGIFSSLHPYIQRGYTSHEKATLPIAGLSPKRFTKLRKYWMKKINGEQADNIAEKTLNWGL